MAGNCCSKLIFSQKLNLKNKKSSKMLQETDNSMVISKVPPTIGHWQIIGEVWGFWENSVWKFWFSRRKWQKLQKKWVKVMPQIRKKLISQPNQVRFSPNFQRIFKLVYPVDLKCLFSARASVCVHACTHSAWKRAHTLGKMHTSISLPNDLGFWRNLVWTSSRYQGCTKKNWEQYMHAHARNACKCARKLL